MVRDFAHFALQIQGNHAAKDAQRDFCREMMLVRPVANPELYDGIWERYVSVLQGEYAMSE
jgi:hypothetical protein